MPLHRGVDQGRRGGIPVGVEVAEGRGRRRQEDAAEVPQDRTRLGQEAARAAAEGRDVLEDGELAHRRLDDELGPALLPSREGDSDDRDREVGAAREGGGGGGKRERGKGTSRGWKEGATKSESLLSNALLFSLSLSLGCSPDEQLARPARLRDPVGIQDDGHWVLSVTSRSRGGGGGSVRIRSERSERAKSEGRTASFTLLLLKVPLSKNQEANGASPSSIFGKPSLFLLP